MKVKFNRYRDVRITLWPRMKILAPAPLMALVVANAWVVALAAPFPGQETSANTAQQSAKEEKEKTTTITGIIVNEKGLPMKGQALELYMVVDGIARSASGAPLSGAVTIGPNRQILGLMMFPVKSETDAAGRFSMELPKYVMVLSGLEMRGWTIVSVDASAKVRALSVNGEMATIIPEPEAPKIDLGELTLAPPAVSEK